jgi:hypothetical protein
MQAQAGRFHRCANQAFRPSHFSNPPIPQAASAPSTGSVSRRGRHDWNLYPTVIFAIADRDEISNRVISYFE